MAIPFTPLTFSNNMPSGYALDENFTAVKTALADAISRTSTSNNEMQVDLDMNGQDLLSIKTLYAQDGVIGGLSLKEQVDNAEESASLALQYKDDAFSSKQLAEQARDEAASSAAAAAVSESNASISESGALSAQLGAETAEAEAKTARDAAFGNADVYADIATGRGAVADGEQFQVVEGNNVVRYRRDSSTTQTEVARYPSATVVNDHASRLISQEAALHADAGSRSIGKDGTPVTGTSGTAGTYMLTGRPAVAGYIASVAIYADAQQAKLKVYRAQDLGGTAYTLAYEIPLDLASGLNAFSVAAGTLGEHRVEDGDVVGVYLPSGVYYESVAGADGYSFFSGDKTDGATFDNLGAVSGTELQLSISVSSASSGDLVKASAAQDSLSRSFSVGELSPAAPSTLQYMQRDRTFGWDWEFKSAAILQGVTLSSQVAGVGKLVVLEPYLGGYRTSRSVQVKFGAGVVSLSAGADIPSDIVVPKGGLIAFKNGTTDSIHVDIYDSLSRHRTFYGDASDGVFPSYSWPSGLEYLSGVSYVSGSHQIRFDFLEVVDPANMATPQYIVREQFEGDLGPVTMQGDEWTKGAGKMSSGATGIDNGLEWVGGFPHLTDFACRWRFSFTSPDAGVYVYKRPDFGSGGSLVGLDMASGNITTYNALASNGTLPGVYNDRATTLTLVQGREYIAVMSKTYRDWSLTITDALTGESDSVVIDGDATAAAGFAYGVPGIATSAGTADLVEFSAWSNRKAPNVLLFGDSITEGTGGTTIADTWAYQVCEAANGVASPRGGDAAKTITKRTVYELNAYPSVRYAIFLMGTNDTDMTVWQRAVDAVAEFCQTYGVVPVFGTLPPEDADTNPVDVQNPYIRSSGYRYIDFARALTIGGDGITRDESKFADALHPNDAGHLAMYQRARLDLPEIFD